MLGYITHEKVEEVIRLAEQARRAPDQRADDPHRGGAPPAVTETGPCQPLEPQPEADWAHAVTRYLDDLPDEALAELVSLYRFGNGEVARIEDAYRDLRSAAMPHDRLVSILCAAGDLPDRLRSALSR